MHEEDVSTSICQQKLKLSGTTHTSFYERLVRDVWKNLNYDLNSREISCLLEKTYKNPELHMF